MIAQNYFEEEMSEDEVDIQRGIELYQIELENFVNLHQGEELQEAEPRVQNEVGYLLYLLGKKFYQIKDYATATEYFETGLAFQLDIHEDYVIDMVIGYGLALINSEQGKTGVVLEAVYEDFDYLADFCFLMGMIYLECRQYEQAVIEFAKAVTKEERKIMGAASYLSCYQAGFAREKQHRLQEAKEFYEKAAPKYPLAAEKLEKLS